MRAEHDHGNYGKNSSDRFFPGSVSKDEWRGKRAPAWALYLLLGWDSCHHFLSGINPYKDFASVVAETSAPPDFCQPPRMTLDSNLI
jgi:hypothetical protein